MKYEVCNAVLCIGRQKLDNIWMPKASEKSKQLCFRSFVLEVWSQFLADKANPLAYLSDSRTIVVEKCGIHQHRPFLQSPDVKDEFVL